MVHLEDSEHQEKSIEYQEIWTFKVPTGNVYTVSTESLKKNAPENSFFAKLTSSNWIVQARNEEGNYLLSYETSNYPLIFDYLNNGIEPTFRKDMAKDMADNIIRDFDYFLLPLDTFKQVCKLKCSAIKARNDYISIMHELAVVIITFIDNFVSSLIDDGLHVEDVIGYFIKCLDENEMIITQNAQYRRKEYKLGLKDFKFIPIIYKILTSTERKMAKVHLQEAFDKIAFKVFTCSIVNEISHQSSNRYIIVVKVNDNFL